MKKIILLLISSFIGFASVTQAQTEIVIFDCSFKVWEQDLQQTLQKIKIEVYENGNLIKKLTTDRDGKAYHNFELNKEYDIIESVLTNNDYSVLKPMLVQIKDISKIMRQIIMQRVSPKLLYQLYKSVCVAKQVYEFVILKEELTEYLQDKIPTFVSLMDKATAIIDYFNETLIMEDCKDIDNITKIKSL